MTYTVCSATAAERADVSTDEIVGVKPGTMRAGELPQTSQQVGLWRLLRLLEQLAPVDRRSIIRQIETFGPAAGKGR